MTLPQWTDQLTLGLKNIDDNHQILFKLLHIIEGELVCSGDGIAPLLTTLLALSVRHFRYEEQYMADLSFPGAAVHKEEHDIFIEKIRWFERGYLKGTVLSGELSLFLEAWTMRHFNSTNDEFRDFLAENRLTCKPCIYVD